MLFIWKVRIWATAALGKNQEIFYFYFSLSFDVLDPIKEMES